MNRKGLKNYNLRGPPHPPLVLCGVKSLRFDGEISYNFHDL